MGDAPKTGKSKATLWIAIGAAVVALLLIVGGIVVTRMFTGASAGQQPETNSGGDKGEGSSLILAEGDSATDAVERYLTALSEGNAAQARAYISKYENIDLLTDEILVDSLTRAPITFVSAEERGEGEYGGTTVTAQYTLGDKSVQHDFTVDDTHDGQWVINDALMRASMSAASDLDVTINGEPLTETSMSLFPGSYTFAIDSDLFEFAGEATVLLARESDREKLYDLTPQLNAEATDTFRALVRASLEECATVTTLAAPCGIDLSGGDISGYTPVEDSVKRTIPAKTNTLLDNLKTRLDYDNPYLVTTSDYLTFDTVLKGKKGDEVADVELWMGGDPGRPSVDFSADEPVVVWDAR